MALGLRAGYGSKPRLPLGAQAAESADCDLLPMDYVRYPLTVDVSASYFGGELFGLSSDDPQAELLQDLATAERVADGPEVVVATPAARCSVNALPAIAGDHDLRTSSVDQRAHG